MSEVIGEFLLERCPNELMLVILDFFDLNEVLSFSMICKLFETISKFWLKNRKIEDKSKINLIMRKSPDLFSKFIDLNTLDHDVLISMVFNASKVVRFRRSQKHKAPGSRKVREKRENSNEKKTGEEEEGEGENSTSCESSAEEEEGDDGEEEGEFYDSTDESDDSYNNYVNEFANLRKSLLLITTKCCPSNLEESTLEREILFPILHSSVFVEGDFSTDLILSICQNPNIELFCFHNLCLRILFQNIRFSIQFRNDIFLEVISSLLSHRQFPGPKSMHFTPTNSIDFRRPEIDFSMDFIRREVLEPAKNTSSFPPEIQKISSFSWFEIANNPDLNYEILKNLRQLIPSWFSYNRKVEFLVILNYLGLELKLWRKTTFLFGRNCEKDVLMDIFLTNEIVDKEKWWNGSPSRLSHKDTIVDQECEFKEWSSGKDYVPNLYENVSIGYYDFDSCFDAIDILLRHNHPILFSDLVNLAPNHLKYLIEKLVEKNLQSKLLPNNWSKNGFVLQSMIKRIFQFSIWKIIPALESLNTLLSLAGSSYYYETDETSEKKRVPIFKTHQSIFLESLNDLLIKERKRIRNRRGKVGKRRDTKKYLRILGKEGRKIYEFLVSQGLDISFDDLSL